MGRPSRRFARAVCAVGAGEVRRLARDRRALLAAVILPALVYPLFFHGRAWLESFSRASLSERGVRVALDLADAPEELARDLARELAVNAHVELVELDAPELAELRRLSEGLHQGLPAAIERQRDLGARALARGVDAVVSVERHPVLAGRQQIRVYHDASDELSSEALARIERTLAALGERVRAQRIERLLGADDPARGLDVAAVDLASPEASGGATLGQILPLLAVLVLLSGSSFAALSVFAGEREAGTLETLLVQPVPHSAVAWGKFYAVLAVGLAALTVNVGSLLVSLALGLGALPGIAPAEGAAVVLAAGGGRLAEAALLFLPAAVLLAALLALCSARAASFRAGQQVCLPLFLAAAIPAVVAGWTDMPCDGLTALVPLLGACLAAREALRGSLELLPGAVAWGAAALWAACALRALAGALSGERVLERGGAAADDDAPRQRARALAWGGGGVLVVYLVGGVLQSRLGLAGLLLTQGGLLPLLAWLCARGATRAGGGGLARELGCAPPQALHALGALLCAPGLAWLVRGLARLQESVAPLPSSLLEAAERAAFVAQAGPLVLFGAFALAPGVCEELFFRGALLSRLRRGCGPLACLFWQALLVGAAHASIHRFAPSAVVGTLLAALTLRSRSVLPAMLLHAGYDALQLLAFKTTWAAEPTLALFAIPGLYLVLRAPGRPAAAGRAPTGAAASPHRLWTEPRPG